MNAEWHIVPFEKELAGLAFDFKVNPDSCGNPGHFENYIRFSAITENRSGQAKTHVVLDKEKKRIMGFVTLKATALLFGDVGADDTSIQSGYPAIEVVNLAVAQDYERMGVGGALVDFVLLTADDLCNQYLGVRYIVLAADPKAQGFYRHKEFYPVQDYFDMPVDRQSADCVPMMMQIRT